MTGCSMTKPTTLLLAMLLVLVVDQVRLVVAQTRTAFRGLPWGVPPGPADPLEPWSLAPQVGIIPTSPEVIVPGIVLPVPTDPASPQDPRLAPDPTPQHHAADSLAADAIPVVLLRQILIDNPSHAVQLRDLFDAGVSWSDAQQLLKLHDFKEYTREYALEDLSSQIRLEVEALADSSWSFGHPWRGRTMFYQVLSRSNHSRAALPALGQGLNAQERSRLAALRPQLRQPAGGGVDNRANNPDDGLVLVVIVKQEAPVYPEGAFDDPIEFIDGEVVLVVTIGRQGDVTKIEVDRSSNRLFEEAAREAAQKSEYRSAKRNGIPEPGIIRLNYTFTVPAIPIDSATGQP